MRPARYPAKRNVDISPEIKAALQAEAAKDDWPLSEIVRHCLDVGLPLVRERRRKARRRTVEDQWNFCGFASSVVIYLIWYSDECLAT